MRWWPTDRGLRDPRHDVVTETVAEDGTFVQAHGPFGAYARRVESADGGWREETTYRLRVPWFGWLMAWPVRAAIARRRSGSWALPPAVLDRRQTMVLGLLAAASMSSAFVNTVFTQTVAFAADDFGVGSGGIGVAGAIVRAGIVLALPAALLADRIGRRRVIIVTAWAAPIITALGALAPNFWSLVATQAIGRPLGLALGFLIAVVAAEEMPRTCRAYAISLLALASGLGAGVAVLALPLADLGTAGWRLVFVVALFGVAIALDISRRLPETGRFERNRADPPVASRRQLATARFVALAVVAIATNVLIAPASFFQNAYLRDVRDYSGLGITAFTFATATPAAMGLVIGGRFADLRGRRHLIAATLPISAVFLVVAFSVGGAPMWGSAFVGGLFGAIAFPALAVFRQELFPTGRRSTAAGFLSASALIGGIGGLLIAGALLEGGWTYGPVMGLLALGQLIAVVVVLTRFPETAQRSLEDLNPGDAGTIEAPGTGAT